MNFIEQYFGAEMQQFGFSCIVKFLDFGTKNLFYLKARTVYLICFINLAKFWQFYCGNMHLIRVRVDMDWRCFSMYSGFLPISLTLV
jgi:hypothetical protein